MSRMRIARRVLSLAFVTWIGAAAPAAAQGEGVFIDPGTPSSKEYVIPIEQARRDAAHGSNTPMITPGERSAPLFGEGVTPDGGATNAESSDGQTGGSATAADGTSGDGSAGPDASTQQASLRPTDGNSSVATLALIGGGVGVVLVGGVAGLLLRRRPGA